MKNLRAMWPWILLAAMALFAAAMNLHWLRVHRNPVMAGHNSAMWAVEQVDLFAQNPLQHLLAFRTGANNAFHGLYNVSCALGMGLFGRSHIGLSLTSTFYYLLLIFATFGIVSRLGNRFGGVVAAFAAMAMPAAMAWSRIVSPHIAIMAVSACGVYLLVLSNWFSRPRPAAAFGALVALAPHLGETVSDGLQVVLVLVLVAFYLLLVGLLRDKDQRKKIIISLTACLLAFLVFFDWTNLTAHIAPYVLQEGMANAVTTYASGSVFHNARAWAAYPMLLLFTNLMWLHCLVVVVAMAAIAWKARRKEGLALVYLLAPLVVFTLISKKFYSYTFAFLPAVPVIIGLAAAKWKKNKAAWFALAFFAFFGFGQFIFLTFMAGDIDRICQIAMTRWDVDFGFQKAYAPVYPPEVREYPPAEAMWLIVDDARRSGAKTVLFITGGVEHTEAMKLRYLLKLADGEQRLMVVDPAYFDRAPADRYELPPQIERPFIPDFILLVPFGSESFDASDRAPSEAFTFYGELMIERIVREKRENADAVRAYWQQVLKETPLDEYQITKTPLEQTAGPHSRFLFQFTREKQ